MPEWLDTPGEALTVLTMVSVVLAALGWLIKANIHMSKEFKPNGGSSLRDQLNRIENRLNDHIDWHLDKEKK
jgi:hypothetical protein